MELAQQGKFAADQQEEQDEGQGEDKADEALGQDVESHDDAEREAGKEARPAHWHSQPESVGGALHVAGGLHPSFPLTKGPCSGAIACGKKEVDRQRHPQGNEDVGYEEASVEVRAERGGSREGSVESGTVCIGVR